MARYRRRRYSRTRTAGLSRRQLNTVRVRTIQTIEPGAGAMKFLDLLTTAQGTARYAKDLTPSTVSGVKGHYSWTLPAATATAAGGYLGVGIREESKQGANTWTSLPAEQWGTYSPLDPAGQYNRWHLWHVNFCAEPTGSGYEQAHQLADNRRFFSIKSSRKMHTVDDSYFLFMDTSDLEETLTFYFECTIFLREP